MPARKSYTQSGLFAQVKSDQEYTGKNSVLKGALAIIAAITFVGFAITTL